MPSRSSHRPRLNGPSGRGTVGSSHRHSLACVCMYAFLALLRQQSHFAASGVSSWCTLPTVRPRVTPYQGFRYTPAARMRARCSGHRYQTESSALAVKSLSVDSPSIESCVMKFVRVSVCVLVQDFRRFGYLQYCVCVCVCVCVWSVPKLVVLISNPAAFAAINQIDGPATILIACVLYHYCSKSATIAIFRPTWSVNHTLVAAPRLERKPTKSRRHHQR